MKKNARELGRQAAFLGVVDLGLKVVRRDGYYEITAPGRYWLVEKDPVSGGWLMREWFGPSLGWGPTDRFDTLLEAKGQAFSILETDEPLSGHSRSSVLGSIEVTLPGVVGYRLGESREDAGRGHRWGYGPPEVEAEIWSAWDNREVKRVGRGESFVLRLPSTEAARVLADWARRLARELRDFDADAVARRQAKAADDAADRIERAAGIR